MSIKRYSHSGEREWPSRDGEWALYADHLAAVREAVEAEREEALQDVLAEAMDCGCVTRIVARLEARWEAE